MHPYLKLHLGSAGYCVLLASLNWSHSVEYSRQYGLKLKSYEPVGFALMISAAFALYLGYRCVRSALSRLESGKRVRKGRWIESWGVLVYALPLLFHRITVSSWSEPDGSLATETGGYGHALSGWVFVYAVLGLFLFQILARLAVDDDEPTSLVARPTQFARG